MKRLLSNINTMDGSRAQKTHYVKPTFDQREEMHLWVENQLNDTKFFSKAISQITGNPANRSMLYDRAVALAERRLMATAGVWKCPADTAFKSTADCWNRVRDKDRVRKTVRYEEQGDNESIIRSKMCRG